MEVLMLNGSNKYNGCTNAALEEAGKILEEEGIGFEIFQIGSAAIRDCVDCRKCDGKRCVFGDDGVNDFIEKARNADGFVFGTPVYFAHPSGRILSFLDRVFYSTDEDLFAGKPAFAVASARRAGTTASLDVMNKYFGIGGMITVGSTYWNVVHGFTPDDVRADEEGMQTMRNSARYMAWLIRCIGAGKAQGIQRPQTEHDFRTDFIR